MISLRTGQSVGTTASSSEPEARLALCAISSQYTRLAPAAVPNRGATVTATESVCLPLLPHALGDTTADVGVTGKSTTTPESQVSSAQLRRNTPPVAAAIADDDKHGASSNEMDTGGSESETTTVSPRDEPAATSARSYGRSD